jgi:LacI family transcriptional regulator
MVGEMDGARFDLPTCYDKSAARVPLAHCSGEPISPDQERIRIDILLRDNLP